MSLSMVYISCQFETAIHRSDYSDYVRALQPDVLEYDANGNRPCLQGVVAAIGTLFGCETVLAMWHRTTEMSDPELAGLGFRRIAGSDLVYRHSALRSDFSDEHPCGMDVPVDFEACESDEEWVLEQWEKETTSDDEGRGFISQHRKCSGCQQRCSKTRQDKTRQGLWSRKLGRWERNTTILKDTHCGFSRGYRRSYRNQ